MPRDRPALRPWLHSFAFALLLWLPALCLELVLPAAFAETFVSPVLRGELAVAAGAWLCAVLAATVAGGLGEVVARPLRRRAGREPAAGAWVPGVLATSFFVVHLRKPVQEACLARGMAPPAAGLALLAIAAVLGLIAAVLVSFPGRARRGLWKSAVIVAAALWLATWMRELDSVGATLLLAAGALPLALWAASERLRARRLAAPAGALFILAAAVLAVALLQPRAGERLSDRAARAGRGRPNVVVFLVDTLRADRTALGGHAITPRLAELASSPRATRFSAATAPASSTVPSVKALFTARSPSAWGLDVAGREPPPADAWTLASAFRRAGYATGAFSANGLIQSGGYESGFERFWSAGGFNFYQHSWLLYRLLSAERYWWAMDRVAAMKAHKIHGETVLGQGLDWIDEVSRGDRPFFAYLHLVEPHWPYESHGYGLVPEGLRDLEPTFDHVALIRLPKGDARNAALRVTPQRREMLGRYDEEVHRADALLGRVLDHLEGAGLADDTLFVFLSDHGEEMFEHNGFGHGYDVFREQVDVPLVVRWPVGMAVAPSRVAEPVSPIDLGPTLADLLGLGRVPARLEGRSLRSALAGGADYPATISESYLGGRCRAAYRLGRYKVRIEFTRSLPPARAARVLAFDLAEDPEERRPIFGDALAEPPLAEVVARAREALQRRWLAWPDRTAGEEGPETPGGDGGGDGDEALEELRALGYVD